MAWHTSTDNWTGNMHLISFEIPRSDLRPGDILNSAQDHVILFHEWEADRVHFSYYSFGSTPVKHVTHASINQATFDGHPNGDYVARRYNKIIEGNSTIAGALGNLDCSGKVDMLAMIENGDLYVYPNIGPAGTTQWAARTLVCSGCGGFNSLNVGDLNSDGKVDLVLRDSGGSVWVYPNVGAPGTVQWGARYLVCSGCNGFDALTIGDLNTDGKADLMMRDSAGTLWVYPNVGPVGTTQWGARYLACSGCGGWRDIN